MNKNENLLIKITNRGALVAVSQFSAILTYLALLKNQNPNATIQELGKDCIAQLTKFAHWLEREPDGTITAEEQKEALKNAQDTLKFIKKQWQELDT